MSRQQDEQHLKLLSIFHYVLAGILAVFGSFPLIHVFLGLMFMGMRDANGPPPEVGLMFVLMGSVFVLAGWTLAGVVFTAAQRLKRRESYMFCFVIACLECVYTPFGTVLGVFTIITLNRPSVKGLFGVEGYRPAPEAPPVQAPGAWVQPPPRTPAPAPPEGPAPPTL